MRTYGHDGPDGPPSRRSCDNMDATRLIQYLSANTPYAMLMVRLTIARDFMAAKRTSGTPV